MPDSLSIEDLIGSGEFESKRSLNGDLRVAMNAMKGNQTTFRTAAAYVDQGQGCNKPKYQHLRRGRNQSTRPSRDGVCWHDSDSRIN